MNSSRLPKSVPRAQPDAWEQKFNALCYEVFLCNPKGKELLDHMECKFFRSPVAMPNMNPFWAYFNEGKNDHIRSYSDAIQKHLNQSKPRQK